ncbi:hypothetical protein SporoP8_11135 [Sporosarcina ureae]|uniref:membrane lipoprotein lipid attachment site-containing protein n=1 Tax=Sporosarcina ureae TaxID=1571 RepID=UPI000A16C337|nr:membrane lipoprotein lipid attachment site-containing protein [Sporosarcina ureae]ARJ39378.1 hypothetical protein SporoP8_11135 [Sporosarcina ureae]
MKKIITLLFAAILLTACSETTNNDYIFIGESEHWEAEYTYNGTEKWEEKDGQKAISNEDHFRFILTYKGPLKELSSLQKIEYSFETNSGQGSGTKEFTAPPSSRTFSSSGGSKGGAKVEEDEVIKVHVKWDDLEESFELHNNNQ